MSIRDGDFTAQYYYLPKVQTRYKVLAFFNLLSKDSLFLQMNDVGCNDFGSFNFS